MQNNQQVSIGAPATGDDEWLALRESLQSGWLTQGPKVKEFEEAFAKKFGFKHALAVSNGTTALHLMLLSLGIGPGDEVILPSFSWIASANAVLYCGATPVFVDIDPRTYNLKVDEVSQKVSSRTKAIMAVHLFGLCADMSALKKIAGSIPIVEDAACAVGSQQGGINAGGFGTLASFSFHARKTLTTGEGGMVVTSEDVLAEKVRSLRTHGAALSGGVLPEFVDLGFNYRLTDLQSAIGIVQLKKLDQFIAERKKWVALYEEKLTGVSWIHPPKVSAQDHHSWQSYVCMTEDRPKGLSRDQVISRLAEVGISTRPGTHAIHMQTYYKNRFGFSEQDFPNSAAADKHSLSLPMHNRLSEEDIDRVVNALKNI